VKLVTQRLPADCGIAALAMYLGLSYGVVKRAALKVLPPSKLTSGGLHGTDLVKVGKALGVKLVRVKRAPTYLHSASGVLAVLWNGPEKPPLGHWVVYLDGVILCPEFGVYRSSTDYLVEHRGRVAMLVTRA